MQIKQYTTTTTTTTVGKCRFWDIDLGNFQNLDNFHF